MANNTEFDYHELMDRAALIGSFYETSIYNHQLVESLRTEEPHNELVSRVEEIGNLLGELYQYVGHLRFSKFDEDGNETQTEEA